MMSGTKHRSEMAVLAGALLGFTGCAMEPGPDTEASHDRDQAEQGLVANEDAAAAGCVTPAPAGAATRRADTGWCSTSRRPA
jgi:hypothetical protein